MFTSKNRKWASLFSLVIAIGMLVSACATPTPEIIREVVKEVVTQVIEVEKEVTKIVAGTPVVEKVVETKLVEKEVTRIVEVEKVITATPEPTLAEKKVLRIGMPATVKNLNFYLSDWIYNQEAVVYTNCKIGQFAPDGTIVPYAATWDVSSDGTIYTFYIKEKAKWHDGEPITAKDVAFTLKMVANPDSGSIYFDKIKPIKGAQAYHDREAEGIEGLKIVDDKTLEVTLESVSPAFLAIMQSFMMIVPEHILGSVDMKEMADAPFWRNPVGCGPYKWVEFVADQYIHLEKFPDFVLGEPKIDEVYLVMGTFEGLGAAFETGNVDFVEVQPTEIERFKQMSFATIVQGDSYVNNLNVNTKRPFLEDVKFRKALMYGIDREQMTDVALLGYGRIAPNCFVTPWTLSPNITEYSYDPEKAKELLEEAGWDGSVDFEILSHTGSPAVERLDLVLQQNLADLGIKSHLTKAEFGANYEKMNKAEFDMSIVGYGTMSMLPYTAVNYIGADSVPPNGTNLSWYEDQELTDLLYKVNTEADEEVRNELFYKITELTTDRLPMLPLVVQQDLVAINTDRVEIPNLVLIPRNRPGQYTWITWNIYEWDIKQ